MREIDEYDWENFDVYDLCPDCLGLGHYTGLSVIETCETCEGAGWLVKGDGLSKAEYEHALNRWKSWSPFTM